MSNEMATILLVEDNPHDVDLTLRALKQKKLALDVHIVNDGEEALAFLRREGDHAHAPRPDLVLLDLNLPRKNGQQVLQEIREDEDLTDLVVVILTTSRNEEDILESYRYHANCYINKPIDLRSFGEIIEKIDDFWFSVVRLPQSNSASKSRPRRSA